MSAALDQFYRACPGIVPTADIDAALHALPAGAADAAVLATVLPLLPADGNPFEYTAGAPAYPGTPMPNATPVLAAALPAQPNVLLPIGGNPALGTVATFARGLPRFQDSNPAPRDGWSIEFAEDDAPGGGW